MLISSPNNELQSVGNPYLASLLATQSTRVERVMKYIQYIHIYIYVYVYIYIYVYVYVYVYIGCDPPVTVTGIITFLVVAFL